MTMAGRSCLVLKNDGLGDLVLSSGILTELSRHFDGGVDLVTCHGNREIAQAIPGLRRIFYVSRGSLRFLPALPRLGLFVPASRQPRDLQVLLQLRSRRYDVAIALRRFMRSSTLALMRWTRAEQRHCAWQFPTNLSAAEAQRASRGWHHWRGGTHPLSEIDYYRAFLDASLGLKVSAEPGLEIPEPRDADVPSADPNSVGLCIGGASMGWGTDHWIATVEALLGDGWTPHLFGGPDAQDTAQAILDAHPACRSHVGRLGFMESVPLLRRCRAFLGNDTGFTHFASLVVPRCLVLLGGGTFGRFFPWPTGHNQWAIYHGLDCFDCDWKCQFAERHCLTRLRPQPVVETFRRMLESRDAGPHWINTHDPSLTYPLAWRYPGSAQTRQSFEAFG